MARKFKSKRRSVRRKGGRKMRSGKSKITTGINLLHFFGIKPTYKKVTVDIPLSVVLNSSATASNKFGLYSINGNPNNAAGVLTASGFEQPLFALLQTAPAWDQWAQAYNIFKCIGITMTYFNQQESGMVPYPMDPVTAPNGVYLVSLPEMEVKVCLISTQFTPANFQSAGGLLRIKPNSTGTKTYTKTYALPSVISGGLNNNVSWTFGSKVWQGCTSFNAYEFNSGLINTLQPYMVINNIESPNFSSNQNSGNPFNCYIGSFKVDFHCVFASDVAATQE